MAETLSFWWLGPGDLVYNKEGKHQTIMAAPPRGERYLVRTALIDSARLQALIREGKAQAR
jgi:hypothetical protein